MTTTSEARAAALAREPLRVAGPQPGFASGTWLSIKDIVGQRELLGMLVRRELKAKYKDSTLGFLWSMLRPLAMLLIYYIALGEFLGAARQIDDFAIFIFTGLTAWTLYSDIVITGTGSIVTNAGLIKKIYLPREVFPLSVVGSALFNFVIQLGILLAATALVGRFPTGGRWLYLPLAMGVLVVFATALALLLSALNVYLRDIQYLVEIIIMVFFWISPIVYSWGLVAPKMPNPFLEQLYLANPMTLVVLGFQQVFWVAGDGSLVPDQLGTRLVVALAVGVAFLWVSQRVFARLQANFAQEL
ncbi:ABC transporter permease [Cellulomonas fimi]|uniref:Transport permease protein n=1 Tax=Cellulomonas fimi TaxID=1708 RepID=A0A7Y0QIG5_CELFI|nr:ABC transporter permease [Cellulomonas fimi]NMR20864.1 ABC transporter permease [Cellulomonas fimi]